MTPKHSAQFAKIKALAGGFSYPEAERAKNDNYATPKCATDLLLREVPFNTALPVTEPACGEGYIHKVLKSRGFKVIASDIRTDDTVSGKKGVDFLKTTKSCHQVITNPPYLLLNSFVEKVAQVCTGQAAMLLRFTSLEGVGRNLLYRKHRPTLIILPSRKLPFQSPTGEWKTSGAAFSHVWVVWDFANTNPVTEFRFCELNSKEIS